MGYRHAMMSSYVGLDIEDIAKDFYDKYSPFVNFSHYWTSPDEYKMYQVWMPFIQDVHDNYERLGLCSILPLQLVFFADEGQIIYDRIDICHCTINGIDPPKRIQMQEPTS